MQINKNLVAVASGSGTAIYKTTEVTQTVFGTYAEFLHLVVYAVVGGACGYIGKLLIDYLHITYKNLKNEKSNK